MLKRLQQAFLPRRNPAIEAKGLIALQERAEKLGDVELFNWTVEALKNGVTFVPSERLKELTYGYKGPHDEE